MRWRIKLLVNIIFRQNFPYMRYRSPQWWLCWYRIVQILMYSVFTFLFQIFSLHFVWRNLIMMCIGMDFFGFILFLICLVSWICAFIFSTNLRSFQLSWDSVIWMLDLLLLPHKFLRLCSFFFQSISSVVQVG